MNKIKNFAGPLVSLTVLFLCISRTIASPGSLYEPAPGPFNTLAIPGKAKAVIVTPSSPSWLPFPSACSPAIPPAPSSDRRATEPNRCHNRAGRRKWTSAPRTATQIVSSLGPLGKKTYRNNQSSHLACDTDRSPVLYRTTDPASSDTRRLHDFAGGTAPFKKALRGVV